MDEVRKGWPMPVSERHKPFEKKRCARCNEYEFRIDGYCTIYCRDMAELEAELEQAEAERGTLQADLGRVLIAIEIGLTDKPSLEKIKNHIEERLKETGFYPSPSTKEKSNESL